MAMIGIFMMMVKRFNITKNKSRAWIVAPTFPLVREDWLIAEDVLRDVIVKKTQSDMKMELRWIGTLEFKSAERDDEGLRGAGLDCAVIDEASRISRKSWEQGLRPALADKLGEAIFISTPKGRNWFYDIFLQGKDGVGGFKSWHYATNTNPYFPQEEWEVIKKTTPEMVLRQEFLAEFLEDDAAVFRGINGCIRGKLEKANDNEYYTIGVDLGKYNDFTVITVIKNRGCQLVEIYRTNKTSWTLQKEMIKGVCRNFRKHLLILDSTGLGDPIADDLRRDGINIKDYKFTNTTKEYLVEQLGIAIEQGLISIPDVEKTQFLINELKSFSYEVLPSGRIRYEAPEGLHDDGVVSLGLAVSGIAHLLYEKEKPPEIKKTGMTADEIEAQYQYFDKQKRSNPFLTSEQLAQKLLVDSWKRAARRYSTRMG